MTNPTYLVNIFYQPARINGQQLVLIGRVTQSIPSYADSYFVASMPEVKVTATGSSYNDALNNLLSTVSSTTDPGNGSLNNIRTY
jgi:hypothetical protein